MDDQYPFHMLQSARVGSVFADCRKDKAYENFTGKSSEPPPNADITKIPLLSEQPF
jgi:hypothetical protein